MNISIGTAVHWFILSLVSCVCSVLSKEQGITVLAVCICYDFFIHHKVQYTVFAFLTLSMIIYRTIFVLLLLFLMVLLKE